MELKHIYQIASAIKNNVKDFDDNPPLKHIDSEAPPQPKDVPLDDMEIHIKVSGSSHYGIDRELYRQTHSKSVEGFVHNIAPIVANINGVKFIIETKSTEN